MAMKFVTRAESAARLYSRYLLKADQNAKLAGSYDEVLNGLGCQAGQRIRHGCVLKKASKRLSALDDGLGGNWKTSANRI